MRFICRKFRRYPNCMQILKIVVLPQTKVQSAIDAARAGSHGGPGRGQGAKAADGATGLKRTNISIDPASAEILRDLGDDDLSLGIRRAAANINKHTGT